MTPQEAFQIAQPGFQAYAAGRIEEGETIADRILAAAPKDPNGLYLKGICRRALRDPDGALDYLQTVDALHPGVLNFILAIGQVLSDLDLYDAAMECFQKAITLHPQSPVAHLRVAELELALRRFGAAETAARKALELEPRLADAHVIIARACELGRDVAGMKSAADAALALAPNLADAVLARARADLLAGEAEAVVERLSAYTPPPKDHVRHAAVLGDALDSLGRYAEAHEAYNAGAVTERALNAPYFENGDSPNGLKRLQALDSELAALPIPAAPASDPDARQACFLVGFPRSGTTLLEQMMAAHPQITTSNEHNYLGSVVASVMENEGSLTALYSASEDRLAELRRIYWASVDQYQAEAKDGLFLDKSPLNMIWLALIGRVFPDARVIMLRRDPRDSVFSAWRRPFGLNPAMFHMLMLDDATAYYDGANRVAEQGRRLCPHLAEISVKYEELASDPWQVCREILAFLDLPWDQRVQHYRDHMGGRAISTPSARQINKSVKGRTIGHWRHYADAMTPWMDRLKPWIDAWGYEAD